MNLAGDGRLDGRITIQKGQGLSQAIAGELGLNENDCKKLGSVWNEIIQSAEKEGACSEEGKKYEEGMTLRTGDVFVFNKDVFNDIIKKVNETLGTSITELNDESTREEETSPVNSQDNPVTDEEIAEEIGITKDKLPSVLLRNTAGISAYIIYRAITDPKFRQQVLPKLTAAEQKALAEAGKKFDEAKAAKNQIKNDIKKGRQQVKSGKQQLKTIEAAEQKVAESQKALEAAKNKVQAETSALKNNPQYQQLKKDYTKITKEINKLETQKATSKSGQLSANSEARLSELKQQKADLLKQKQNFEKKLNAAKQERNVANKNLKNNQADKLAQKAEKNAADALKKKDAALKALKDNPEYKDVSSKLRKLKTLENKKAAGKTLTDAETKALKELSKQKATLNKKLTTLSKDYNAANSQLKAAQAEAKTYQSMVKNAKRAKSGALAKIKKGRNKVKINLKKLPKGYAKTLGASLSKMGTAAKVGGKVLRGAGKIAKPLMVIVSAFDIYDAYQTGGTKKAVRRGAKLGTSMGGAWAGAKLGAAGGAAIGSVVPGAGTVIGGFVGGVVGGFAGWWAGEKAYDAAESVILPDEIPLDVEAAQQGEVELELSEEEITQLLEEYPDLEESIEWVE